MRSSSDDLYRLIKSLNKGEKRSYSQAASQQSGDKVFDALFRILDDLDTYDVEDIAIQLRRKGFEKCLKQFPVLKNYLYNFIMRVLCNHDKDSSYLSNDIKHVVILERKGLYDIALKVLQNFEKKSIQAENYELTCQLYDRKCHLIEKCYSLQKQKSELHGLRHARESIREYLNSIEECFSYYENARLVNNKEERGDLLSKLYGENLNQIAPLRARLFIHLARYQLNNTFCPEQSDNSYKDVYNDLKKLTDPKSKLIVNQNYIYDLLLMMYRVHGQDESRVKEITNCFNSWKDCSQVKKNIFGERLLSLQHYASAVTFYQQKKYEEIIDYDEKHSVIDRILSDQQSIYLDSLSESDSQTAFVIASSYLMKSHENSDQKKIYIDKSKSILAKVYKLVEYKMDKNMQLNFRLLRLISRIIHPDDDITHEMKNIKRFVSQNFCEAKKWISALNALVLKYPNCDDPSRFHLNQLDDHYAILSQHIYENDLRFIEPWLEKLFAYSKTPSSSEL